MGCQVCLSSYHSKANYFSVGVQCLQEHTHLLFTVDSMVLASYISWDPQTVLLQCKLTVTMFSAARSGTTVTFVIIDGWVVTVASVGDSRCILESAEGSVYFLSADHRLDANEEEYVLTSQVQA